MAKKRTGPKHLSKGTITKSRGKQVIPPVHLTQDEWDAVHCPPKGKDAFHLWDLLGIPRIESSGSGHTLTRMGKIGDLVERDVECEACGAYWSYVASPRKLICVACRSTGVLISEELDRVKEKAKAGEKPKKDKEPEKSKEDPDVVVEKASPPPGKPEPSPSASRRS